MEGLISSFNEVVADLEECKKNITLDYKQFRLDVSVINNGLHDPEIMTSSDFSDSLLDEAINVRNIVILIRLQIIYFVYFMKITVRCIHFMGFGQ